MSKLNQVEKQSAVKLSFTDPQVFDRSDESEFSRRFDLNRNYVNSLKVDNLLQNHYTEAAIRNWNHFTEDCHKGWESPVCQLRGHFTGHWLSAAARIYAQTGDMEVYGKACRFVDELAKCQRANGGRWAGSIPEKYFWKMEQGQSIWAPHYTVHKLFMGLADMKRYGDSNKALEIASSWADWFIEWTDKFSRSEMDRILDYETGGMLEAWVDLYDLSGDEKFRLLIDRYYRPKLFERLLAGEDVLTLRHANTTIPEIHGCARAYEVFGDEKYRRICEEYWKQAVTERGWFATGGQTACEVWTPKHKFANRLARTNQEHCTVYNMIRLADFLYRWSGDVQYLDYIERNLYNGILAQQNRNTGMVIYYLPLHSGAKKAWGTPTDDFWCCHGSLVQAHTLYAQLACYSGDDTLTVAQFIPGFVEYKDAKVTIDYNLNYDTQALLRITVAGDERTAFDVKIRVPWWTTGVTVNGQAQPKPENGFVTVSVKGKLSEINVVFGKEMVLVPIPDEPTTAAFMNGPEVLAGICDREQVITIPKGNPRGAFRMYDEADWHPACYHLIGQGIKFVPISTIVDETYTVYFPIREE